MSKQKVGTREEWLTARTALLERERELTRLESEIVEQRRALPWVPVEKAYTFDTEDGTKTLAELFEGRSELLAYHVMFGPDWTAPCPGCSGPADHFIPDGAQAQRAGRDDDLHVACADRDGRLRRGPRRLRGDEGMAEVAASIGTDVAGYVTTEGPGFLAFALRDGIVHHTYTAYAPELNVLVFSQQLLERAPKGGDSS